MRRIVIAFSVALLAGAVHADEWIVVASEDFEGTFPQTDWQVYDEDGSSWGEYHWGRTNEKWYSGGWSGWCARGGANGQFLTPGWDYYPYYCKSVLATPWLDFSDANDVRVRFWYWLESEPNWYDYLEVRVHDGYNSYSEWSASGNFPYWQYTELYLGQYSWSSNIQVQFRFYSDSSSEDYGAFIDDIQVEKFAWVPPSPVAVIRANPQDPDPGQTVNFDGWDSYHPEQEWGRWIVSWEWDFDYDGVNFEVDWRGEWASWEYPDKGFYTVALQVTDDQGTTGMATLVMIVGDEDKWVFCGQVPRDSGPGMALAALLLIGGAAVLRRRLARAS